MSSWEVIGWILVAPVSLVSLWFVLAVSVAVVRAIADGDKTTVSDDHPSNVTPIRKP